MSNVIPDNLKNLLEEPIVVGLVTIMPDGHPQATPVWCSYDDEHIHQLSKLYFNRDDFYANTPELRGKETRVIYKIKPLHVTGQ
jgi:hypothetical protein